MIHLAKKYNLNIKDIEFKRVSMWFGMASWTLLTPNTVYLNKGYDDWDMIDEVAHELIHREQCKRDGIFVYLVLKTLGRLFFDSSYEAEAYAEQERIDTLKRII